MGFKALTNGLGEPFLMGDRSAWNTGIGQHREVVSWQLMLTYT